MFFGVRFLRNSLFGRSRVHAEAYALLPVPLSIVRLPNRYSNNNTPRLPVQHETPMNTLKKTQEQQTAPDRYHKRGPVTCGAAHLMVDTG